MFPPRLFRIPALAVDGAADRVHDCHVLGLVLEHLGVALGAFHVGLLRSLLEEPRELAVLENLRVGGTGYLAQPGILEQAVEEVADDDAVTLGEVALVALVYGGHHLVQKAPLLFHLRGGRIDFRGWQVGGLRLKGDSTLKGLLQLVELQREALVQVDAHGRVVGKQAGEVVAEDGLLAQLPVEHPGDLIDEALPLDEGADGASEERALLLRKAVVGVHHGLEGAGNPPLPRLLRPALLRVDGADRLDVGVAVDVEVAELLPLRVDAVDVELLLQPRLLVVRLERLLYLLVGVHEVEDEGVLLARIGAVQAAQRLHGLDIAQLLVNHHGMEQRLVKAGLVFLGYHKDAALVVEHRLGLALRDAVALRVAVHAAFGVLRPLRVGGVLDCAGEGYHHGDVIVPLRLEVVVDGAVVAHRGQPGRGHHHHLPLAADGRAGLLAEGLHNELRLLLQVVGVEFLEAPRRLHRRGGRHLGVVGDALGQLVVVAVGGVVQKHVQDEAFLDGLPHGVDVERADPAVGQLLAEELERLGLRRGGEGEEGEVLVLAVVQHLLDDAVLGVADFLLALAFELGIFAQGVGGVRQGDFQLHRAVARLAGMRLVHDDREVLLPALVHLLEDDWELLEGGDDDAEAVVDGVPQVLGGLLVVDEPDQPLLVLEAVDGGLQLCVKHPAVGHHDDGAEDRAVPRIVESRQAVCRPGDGVGLAAPRAVLDEVVLASPPAAHVGDELAHHVELVVAGEDDFALPDFLDLPVGLPDVLLLLRVADELLEDVEEAVPLQDVLPDIAGDVVGVPLHGGIALAAVAPRAVGALVERQEVRLLAVQLRGHGAVIQVHRHENLDAVAEAEAFLTRVAVGLPLDDAVADVLSAKLVLEFDGHDGYAVDGQHHVHAVAVLRRVVPLADALAGVRLVLFRQVVVEGGFGLEVADAEVDAPVLEAVAQDMDEAVLGHLVLEALVEALLRVAVGLFYESFPVLRLGPLHEVHQRVDVQRLLDGCAVARVRCFGPAAFWRSQPLLDVGLEVLLSILVV